MSLNDLCNLDSTTMTKQSIGSVIIVGGGPAGTHVAAQLAKACHKTPIKITVVDRQNYMDWSVASARMLVQPDSMDTYGYALPLNNVYKHLGKDYITFVHSAVQKISSNSVTLENGTILEADVIVIAIGGQYANGSIWKPLPEHTTKEIRIAAFRSLREKVVASKSIIVTGAGPTGVEIAAEIKSEFPNINVILIGTLLPVASPGFRIRIQKELESIGVIIKEGRIDIDKPDSNGNVVMRNGEIIQNVDLILNGAGFVYAGAKLADDILKVDLNECGQFHCRPTLQLATSTDTVFCCGDIVAVPDGYYADIKGMMNAESTADIVATNIIALLQKKKTLKNFKWSSTPIVKPNITVLGPKTAIADMGLPNFIENFIGRTVKSKDFFMSIKGSSYGKGKTW